ncbi:MAG: 1,4-alpha-glucan branching protein GlgB [Armatimonadota bacterium]|nr:1,4-alpha-glucan branching protein GlgB [Armatimonadota bacterium]MDW8155838.1 1,4-alpha-glucan branching protein GlgB [Armatimonadota bacterium]
MIGELDVYLFREGTHTRLYEKLGSHPGEAGTHFAVWAPNAASVRVMGDFNGWDPEAHALEPLGESGLWAGLVRSARPGHRYKYRIVPKGGGPPLDKADPFAFWSEPPPGNASVVWDLSYTWQDGAWMAGRAERNALDAPVSVYEVHLGSWARGEGGRHLTYRELATRLAEYVRQQGFTHVELLPVMEHPFYGSWGYHVTGYFAPTCRYGTPQDFMSLVDALHQAGVGVILDWVPSHFATDPHGLARFDGSALYEHPDPRRGWHPDWGSAIFDYGRPEVRSFLLSSAHFWLDRYHADGLRVDAVASMLYLDYSRREGEWLPNEYGGRENLDAIRFLRRLNESVYRDFPGVQTVAEESTAWPLVSRPTSVGGLGFGMKWDMGWMHDTLRYLGRDPVYRKYHHHELTFRMLYAFSENFLLPLSHDEVVHGKRSLLEKMPGDDWQKFANLRLLLGYQYAQPGKKLLFMGAEVAQRREWDHESSVDWHLLADPHHAGVQRWVRDLNRLYREEPALHQLDCDPAGFEWIDPNDRESSVLSFLRKSRDGRLVAVVCNFTPVPREGYRVGVPEPGRWQEVLNSDAREYGGSGWGNYGGVQAEPVPHHGRPCSLRLALPPLGVLFLRWEGNR